MRRLLLMLGILAGLGLLASSPAAAGLRSVWAVDDGEKIYQDDTDNPLENGEGNSVWDGWRVSLLSAGNEIAAFQLILEADASGASGVNVTVSTLTNGPNTIRGSHPLPAPNDYVGVGVELFTEHYLNVTDPSGSPTGGYFNWSAAACPNLTGLMPDALVPFSAAVGKGGAPFTIAPNLNQSVWVDIYVDKGLPAGTYTGTIIISAGGMTHSVIPLEVEVLGFDLPDENHYQSMVFYGGTGDVRRKHNTGCCTPEMWQTMLDYNRMAHRHRLDLIGSGFWGEQNADRLGGTLSGEAYTPAEGYEGPGEGVGNSVFSIATYGGWWGLTQSDYESLSDDWEDWFTTNAPSVTRFLYLTDEPPPSLYPEIVTKAAWIHDNPGPGQNLPVFVTKHPTSALIGAVDIWGDPTASYDTVTTAAARARGEEVYPYAAYRPKTTADVIDEYGIGFRLKPWIAHKCDISRWFTWESTHWSGNSNELDPGGYKNVWVNPKTFETSDESSCGNGDGTLFYPGRDYDFPAEDRQYPGPIASYRMKMYRRGAQDVEYMWLAEQAGKGGDVVNVLENLLPHVMDDALTVPDWSNHNQVYEAARYELAELLGPSAAPVAKFQSSPSRGAGPLSVSFTDLSTHRPTSWSWNFGDGSTSSTQHPTHVYNGLGGYTVTLTATNAQGSDTVIKGNCATVVDEVVVYPDSWDTQGGWAPVTLVSGGLSDVHDDDGAYMVTRCDPDSQRHAVLYYADTSYTPSQIARITIEYQGKSSRSDNPSAMLAFVRPSDGNWSNGCVGNWYPTTTDGWYTFETTDIAGTMGSDGVLGFELCGCPANASNYDISTDAMRFRLELAGGGPMAPVAALSGSPATGPAPLTANFTDASANAPTSWSWDFGDGGNSTAQHPSHSFTTGGRYTVSLTVTNARGSDTLHRTNYVTVTFLDLPPTYWAWGYIEACRAAGIVGGYGDGTYRPSLTVTRDMMAVYTARALAGGDASVPTGPATATFSDVPTDHWAFKYVEYAAESGVVGGYPDGTYRPTVTVTRDQMAVFVARAMCGDDASVPSGPPTATFSDVPTDYWAFRYVEYIAGEGVTGGYPDGTYRPTLAVTRDQMAVYVQRALVGATISTPERPRATAWLMQDRKELAGLRAVGRWQEAVAR